MKTAILYGLVLLTMLGIGLSCKKTIEEVKPPVVTPPGSSTSTPPVSTNSKMVRMVFKEASKQVFEDVPPEEVMINGKPVWVNKKSETTYFYDSTNQLVLEVLRSSPTLVDSTRFYYYPTYVVSAGYGYNNGKYVGKLIDTVMVDENGFMKQFSGGHFLMRDSNGYFLNYSSDILEIKDKDVVRTTTSALEGDGHIVITYDYDMTKSPPPRPRSFWGPESYRLRLKQIISQDGPPPYPDGPVYIITNEYAFDLQSKVIRKTQYAERTRLFWPYTTLSSITEYYYAP